MDTIILASQNRHKAREFSRLFSGRRVLLPSDMGIEFEYEERGDTFLANAMGKAQALYSQLNRGSMLDPSDRVLADDSGICTEALDGAPGVYSARWGEKVGAELRGGDRRPLDDAGRTALLLHALESQSNRHAWYVCCVVLIAGHDRFFVTQETWHGDIGTDMRGSGGFGYDPIFRVPGLGRSAAELSDEEKDRLSHRGKAARSISKIAADADRIA